MAGEELCMATAAPVARKERRGEGDGGASLKKPPLLPPDAPGAVAVRAAQSCDLEGAIDSLRSSLNAIILAHYYQDEEIQDIADMVGDSLALSRRAAQSTADVIVFCGVRFMAEVAKILAPQRVVLLPDMNAGCSLEDSCRPPAFRAFRARHPDHVAITYINCSVEVKALSDVIVTSSNAEAVINSMGRNEKLIFAPDRHLGAHLARLTGRDMLLWPGTCVVHEQFSEREIVALRSRNPGALLTAHPECPQSVLRHADHIGSTSAMLRFVAEAPTSVFIVATEAHLIHQMKKLAPDKTFLPAPGLDGTCSCARCPYMALNSMEKLHACMAAMAPRIEIEESLRLRALRPLERMLALSPPSLAAGPNMDAAAPLRQSAAL